MLVKFRDGFETVQIDQLLSVAALESVARRFNEREIELELGPGRKRDMELEPELGDEELAEQHEEEFYEEVEGD